MRPVFWISACSVLALIGCSGPDSAKAMSNADKPVSVRVVTAAESDSPVTVPILGAITAQSHASLGAELDGRVLSLMAKEGDRVKAGQAIVQLTSADAQARLSAAQGGLQQAIKAADADVQITQAKLLQAKLDFNEAQDRLNSEVTLASAKVAEAQANYDRLKRGARPQEIQSADADVKGAELVVESDQTTVEYMKRTLKRKTDLYAQGGISQNDVDQAQLDYDHAVQATQVAQAQLRSRQLFANLLKEGTPKEEMAQAAAQVSGAQESLRAAKANLLSLNDARQAVAVAQADYDRALARLQQLQAGGKLSDEGAKVQLAQEDLQRTQIRSPIDGVLASIKVGRGQVVRPGQTVAEVVAQGGLRMEATAMDQDADRVRAGLSVQISLRSDPGRTFQGVVEAVLAPSSESRAPRIIVTLPRTAGLSAGAVANGEILTDEKHKVVTIPSTAIFGELDSAADVFVVAGALSHQRPVQLGPKRGDRVEIVSGLSPGELVVAQPSVSLHDGSRVSVGEGK